MLADIFNKPVNVGKNPDSNAQGAFLVSATEMGLYKSLEEAARSVVPASTFKPQKQNHTVYMQYFTIFERLSVKLFDEFEAITNLQNRN
jgi:gluconokinase